MICPHCNKPIPRVRYQSVDKKIKQKALTLYKKGYSCRDIEMLLKRQISYSTVARIVREES